MREALGKQRSRADEQEGAKSCFADLSFLCWLLENVSAKKVK